MSDSAPDLYKDLSAAVDEVCAKYKELLGATASLTLGQIFALIGDVIATMVMLVQKYVGVPADVRKQIVMAAISSFYDAVIAPIEKTKVPLFLEPFVERGLKEILLTAASAGFDSLVNVLGHTSVTTLPVKASLQHPHMVSDNVRLFKSW